MAEPVVGYQIRTILEALILEVAKITGLTCVYQPEIVRLKETGLIFIPEGIEIAGEEETRVRGYKRLTAVLRFQVVLTGEGVGGEFLAETIQASLQTAVAFRSPLVVKPAESFEVVFTAERTSKGRYYNLEEETGFIYEEVWNGNLYFPITVPETPGAQNLSAPGFIKEIHLGGV